MLFQLNSDSDRLCRSCSSVSIFCWIPIAPEDEVKNELTDLKEQYPESPSVMFLNGVLTENGQEAVVIYGEIVDVYPE